MKIKSKILVFALFFVIFAVYLSFNAFASTPGNISSCQTLDTSGIYVLNQSISVSGDCFTLTNDNITINGNGFDIRGDSTGYGFVSSDTFSNITIENFNNMDDFIAIETLSSSTVFAHNNSFIADTCKLADFPGTYRLNQSIVGSGNCFNIFSDNVTLDGNNFNLTGDSTGSAFTTSNSLSNITIENFNNIDKFTPTSSFVDSYGININNNYFIVSKCKIMDFPGTYRLNQSINTLGNCFNVTSDNVILNGNNKTIKGNVNISAFNFTAKNISFNGAIYSSNVFSLGVIAVVHSDGSITKYVPGADTDLARGTALTHAVSVISNGDAIYLSQGIFNINQGQIDLSINNTGTSSIHGAGKTLTEIQSGINSNSIIQPGLLNSQTTDLTITDTAGQYAMPWGSIDTAINISNAFLANAVINGRTDGVYFSRAGIVNATLINVDISTLWDVVRLITGTGNVVLNIYNSRLIAVSSNLPFHGQTQAHTVYVSGGGTINIWNSTLNASGGTQGIYGAMTDINGGSAINLYGSNVNTFYGSTGSGIIFDIENDTGFIGVSPSTTYNASKVSGQIIQIGEVPEVVPSLPAEQYPNPFPLSQPILLTNSLTNLTNSTSVLGTNGRLIFNNSIFYNNNGKILFYYLSTNQTNFSLIFNIGSNYAFVNTSSYSDYNVSANVTLFNTPTNFVSPQILKDGVLCLDCYNFTSLNAGNVTFNVTSWSNYTISEDITPPSIIVNSPSNRSYNISSTIFNITLNEQGIGKYSLDSSNNISMSTSDNLTFSNMNSSMTQGIHIVVFYANDSAGNMNSTSITFFIDSVSPQVTIVIPANGQEYASSSVSINISLNERGNCTYSLDSGVTNNTLSADSGNVSFTGTVSGLSNGAYTLNGYCNDTVGNRNDSVTSNFTINVPSGDTPSGGGPGGSTSVSHKNITLSQDQIDDGNSNLLSMGDGINFNISNAHYYVKISSINKTDNSSNIIIYPSANPIKLVLGVQQMIDTDGDGKNDISILLSSFSGNSENITIKKVILIDNVGTSGNNETNNGTKKNIIIQDVKDFAGKKWGYLILIIIICIVGILSAIYFVLLKEKQKEKVKK